MPLPGSASPVKVAPVLSPVKVRVEPFAKVSGVTLVHRSFAGLLLPHAAALTSTV
jgi:hypothetical protein